jgi:M6 family metalloprotease-like protein
MLVSALFGQSYEICGEPYDSSYSVDRTQTGGRYIPSTGVFKILVVFARFPDDNEAHNNWPVGGDPDNYESFIDPDENINTLSLGNITSYFSEMSYDNYEVIGDVVSVQTPQESINYQNVVEASTDLLQNAVDPLVDFSDYDNWTEISDYNHDNSPDGIVDYIIVIWRGKPWATDISGWASISISPFNADGVTVTSRGATVQYIHHYGMSDVRKVAVHEMGHHLIGPHPYGIDQHYAIWGLLGNRFHSGSCANSFERYKLG